MMTSVLSSKVDELYHYVQERFLWQFYSRTWDRTENIDGIVAEGTCILLGEATKRDTPTERLLAVEAKVMVDDFHARFPWLKDATAEEVRVLMSGLREKLTDVAITSSKNHELNHTLY